MVLNSSTARSVEAWKASAFRVSIASTVSRSVPDGPVAQWGFPEVARDGQKAQVELRERPAGPSYRGVIVA